MRDQELVDFVNTNIPFHILSGHKLGPRIHNAVWTSAGQERYRLSNNSGSDHRWAHSWMELIMLASEVIAE